LGQENSSELFEHAYDLGRSVHFEVLYNFARQYLKGPKDTNKITIATFALFKIAELGYREPVAYNLLGLYLENQGQYERALTYFQKALELSSSEQTIPIKENLARCLCSNKQYSQSVEEYQQVLKTGNAYTFAGYGLALFLNESYQESLSAFETALKMTSQFESITLGNHIAVLVAQVLNALGEEEHLELAKQQLLECFSKDPTFVQAILCLASMGIALEDWTLAQSAASELVKLEPHVTMNYDEHIDVVLSRMFLLQGDSMIASRFMAKSIHRYPWQAKRWSRYSEFVAIHNHQIQNAKVLADCADVLDTELDSVQNRSDGLCIAGLVQLLSADEQKSKSDLSRAILLNPSASKNWFALGMHRAGYQDYSLMETCIEASEVLTKDEYQTSWNQVLLCNSLLAQARKGDDVDLSDSVQLLDSIASNHVGFLQEVAYTTLGRMLIAMGEIEASIQSLKNSITLAASNTHHWIAPFLYLAQVYEQINRNDAAGMCYDAALHSNDKTLLLFQSLYLLRKEQYEKALELLNEFVKSAPTCDAIVFMQTICYQNIDPKKYSYRITKNVELLGANLDRDLFSFLRK
jgi:tetratricopeptide (TPR) repeat protein